MDPALGGLLVNRETYFARIKPDHIIVTRGRNPSVLRGGSYWLQDTSKNGTWVDNTRVYGEAPLVHGSVIVIGDNVLRLEQSLL